MNARRSRQLRRELVTGSLSVSIFGTMSLLTGSYAAAALTAAGLLMIATSAFPASQKKKTGVTMSASDSFIGHSHDGGYAALTPSSLP